MLQDCDVPSILPFPQAKIPLVTSDKDSMQNDSNEDNIMMMTILKYSQAQTRIHAHIQYTPNDRIAKSFVQGQWAIQHHTSTDAAIHFFHSWLNV